MLKTPLNLAMLGDPQAAQYCDMLGLATTFAPLADPGCSTGVTPLFSDDLTDLAIDASGTFTGDSTRYHQNPDGLWVPIAANEPRWKDATWTGTEWTGETTGLLMEPADVNNCRYPFLTNWALNGVTAADAGVASPYGPNYIRTIPTAASSPHFHYLTPAAATLDAAFWLEFSVGAAGYNWCYVEVHEGGAAYNDATKSCAFTLNLVTGVFGTDYKKAHLDFESELQQDGKWRMRIKIPSFTATGRAYSLGAIDADRWGRTSWVGDAVSGIDVAGITLTTQKNASFILTDGASVARAVDALPYADIPADNETRLIIDGVPVDIDDWDGNVPVPTAPQVLSDVIVYAPGERPA